MVDFLKRIILKEIYALFFLTPIVYLISKLTGHQSLYAFKDVVMMLITLQVIFLEIHSKTKYDKNDIIFLFIYCFYIIIATLFRMEDIQFWFIGLREVCITPLMLIIIGIHFSNNRKDCLTLIKKSLYFSTILTIAFSIIFFQQSYGTTNRLVGFWDSEHEPGIIGALLIVICIAEQYQNGKIQNNKKLVLPVLLGGFCIILCKSRSCILALFVSILFIFADKINLKSFIKILAVTFSFLLLLHEYENITNRSLDYNLRPRTDQYTMAWELIRDNFLIGIGIDKYGVMGSQVKILRYGNYFTTTMDSTIIKYMLNLGFIFIFLFSRLIIKVLNNLKNNDRNIFAAVIFGLCIGAVTGKLGAYPMNQYFYFILGFYFISNRHESILQHKTYSC